ncbi:adhesion G protein-coupled receptor E3-like [Palaemon carinicauda]|uniref:adhesion G protein-coupled receptor E3-like n=1 Tax=Palaemon carinicauda TaxID=392227 RepID=UPI0035B5EF33
MAFCHFIKVALLCATLFSTLQLCVGFGYPDLMAMNATCPPKDTCKITRQVPSLDESSSWKYRNCFCDDLCAKHGDCCLDAHLYVAEEQRKNVNSYECVTLTQFGSLYMIGQCIPGWKDEAIAEQCTAPIEKGSDPFREMPVTSLETYVTYKNYYCASCNNDTSSYEIWRPRLECPTLEQYQKVHRNLSTEFVSKELVYKDTNWGLHVHDEGSYVFHNCYIYPVMPETVTHMVRPCEKEVVKTCPSTWTDEVVNNLCSSYTAIRYMFDIPYKNIHCALCNDVQLEDTHCMNRVFFRDFFSDSFNNQSFAMLMDFKDRRGGNIVGSTSTCQLGEVFDPFFKKCRKVICGRSNQEYRFGRCVDMALPKLVTEGTTTPISTLGTQSPIVNNTIVPVPEKSGTSAISLLDESNSENATILDSTISRLEEGNNETTLPLDGTTSQFDEGNDKSASILDGTISPDLNNSNSSVLEGKVSSNANDSESISSPIDNTTFSVDSTAKPLLQGSNEGVEVKKVSLDANKSGETVVVPPVANDSDNNSIGNLTFSGRESNNGNTPAKFLPCEKFFLPNEEYVLAENGTVEVEKYKRTYEANEYELSEGGILVCIIQMETEKFSRVMGWVTLGGLGLSCVCLMLHLIAFLVVPELRNLSGKNLSSLCLVLLGAFSTFILSTFGEPGGRECFILAISMYYFFLSSFCWVNIMAFDVWRTLSLATTELRVSAGGQCCKFMVYAVYGWLFPAAAVIGVLLLDIMKPEFLPAEYYPAFGEYWCWFGHRKALLVFFAAPLMTIMVLNIMLFILSARIIANTMESTAKMTSCAPYQSQFKLYMRLALLMGLTWISGIVAGYLQVEAIWYIFVLLNTLQGVFIFLAFTCTRKVWHTVSCGCFKRLRKNRSWACRSHSTSKQGLQSTNSNTSNLSQTIPSPTHFSANAQMSSS